MKTLFAAVGVAAAIGAAGPASSSVEHPWDKVEQTIWTASCETFRTPHHSGATPCDGATTEVHMSKVYNDGSAMFSFGYAPGLGKDSREDIFFDTAPPTTAGLYPITEVQDEVSEGPVKTFGFCDMRGADEIRCTSGADDNKITISYHLISQDMHSICAMNADRTAADMSRCVFPDGGRKWKGEPSRPLEEIR